MFGHDMLLPIPVLADIDMIRERRQTLINRNTQRQNLQRHVRDYVAGEQVLLHVHEPNQLEQRAIGPFIIQQVHGNGTVTIQRDAGVLERVNLRRVRPYVARQL